MTHEEIIEMAEKCGFYEWRIKTPQDLLDLIAFAKMVAAKEREACELVCKEIYRAWVCESDDDVDYPDPHDCIRAIRARGEA